ncbi:hypothetical protein D3C86_1567530 [compost metagenome]
MAGRDQTRPHQRPHQADEAGRIAAGVRHPRRGGDGRALTCIHLGETIGPGRIDPERRRGVDDPHRGVLDHRHGFLGRIVGQAQDDRIGAVQRLAPRRDIAPTVAQQDQLQIVTRLQTLADLQPRGPGLAVDEDLMHRLTPSPSPNGRGLERPRAEGDRLRERVRVRRISRRKQ